MGGMNITASVAGLDQVGTELQQIGDGITAGAGSAVEGACRRITARAQAYVPVLTGALRGSIDYAMRGPTLGVVGVGPPGDAYWFYLEYGTRYVAAIPFFRAAAEPEAAAFDVEMVRIVERACAGAQSDQGTEGEGGGEGESAPPEPEIPIPE
jgi:HK97 gp10 family phage protein